MELTSEQAVQEAYANAVAPFRQPDGSYRIGASFRCLTVGARRVYRASKRATTLVPLRQASDEIMILSAVGFTAHRHDFPESQLSGVLTP
jgi:hypothetical protein